MGKKTDSLGDRMKGYENASRFSLTRRVPVIIRLDGKAFHTFTRGLQKPFDKTLMTAMQKTMQYLCENVQNCVFGYTQSDEITLVLTDYKTINTDAWFGNGIQKMVSVAASMATLAFNRYMMEAAEEHNTYLMDAWNTTDDEWKYGETLHNKILRAMFDARVFTIPKDEVCNCLIWRQQDATRNSIEAVGQAFFSSKELHKKTCNNIQDMLWKVHNINWNDYPVDCKRGACCYKKEMETPMQDPRDPEKTIVVSRRRWVIDKEPPIFTQDRAYIERWL